MTREDIFRNHLESACTECGFTDDALVAHMMKAYVEYTAKAVSPVKPKIRVPSKDAMSYAIDVLEERKVDFTCEYNAELLCSALIESLSDVIAFLKQVNERR